MAELPKPPKRVTLHYNAAGDFMFKDDSGRLVICGGKSFGPDVEAVYVLERVSHRSSAFLTEEEKRAKVAAAVLPSGARRVLVAGGEMTFFDDHIATAATAMVGQLEEEIRRALDAHWCNGWTYDDVRRRCILQRVAHDPVETFIVDGVPLLHIWPVETEMEQHEDRVVMRYTRQIRRLYASREDQGNGA